MTLELLFWILILLWLVSGFAREKLHWAPLVGDILQLLLFIVLGWRVFGPAIHS